MGNRAPLRRTQQPAPTAVEDGDRSPRLSVPGWLRAPLRAWWLLIAFAAAALAGSLLLLPLALYPGQYLAGVQAQLAAVLALARARPLLSAAIALLLVLLTALGYLAHRATQAADQRADQARQAAIARDAAREVARDDVIPAVRGAAALSLAQGAATWETVRDVADTAHGMDQKLDVLLSRDEPARLPAPAPAVSDAAPRQPAPSANPGASTAANAAADLYIFISHAHADNALCDPYANALTVRGVPHFYDRDDPQPGASLSLALQEALQRATVLLVMASPAALASFWVQQEIDMFFALMSADPARKLIPIMIEPCDLPPRLKARWWLDATTQSTGDVVAQVLRSLAGPRVPRTVIAPLGMPRPFQLVGRDDELRRLMDRLRGDSTVGVCAAVEGMGGVGKTALAAEAVALLAEDRATFPGGAAWISCEALTGAEGLAEVWGRIARALGFERIATQPDAEARRVALGAALAQRTDRLLLALDNVEPGLDVDALVNTLAQRDRVTLLLTARQNLKNPRVEPQRLSALADPNAIALFAALLRRYDEAHARPTPSDEPHIPAIVRAVGGLPLALELTAAYAAEQRLPLTRVLAEMPAALGDPKQGVAARFDRSWAVLTAPQRRLFAGLSLLDGSSFPRAAALALATAALPDAPPSPLDGARQPQPFEARGADPAPPDPAAIAALATLVRYALVEALDGERLRLHPLLRDYAATRLAAYPTATREALGDAALAYWLRYAQSHPGYAGMDALEAEAPGLMGAIEWARAHQRHRPLIALAKSLSTAWDIRGRRDEALRMFALMSEAARASEDLGDENWAAHSLAMTLSQIGKNDEARAGYERALALARQLGDPAAEQREVHELAVLDAEQGDVAAARAGFERALALARQLGDPAAEASELRSLGVLLAQYVGEMSAGRALIERALAISERLGDVYAAGKSHQFVAMIDEDAGDTAAAIARYREALRRFVAVGSPDAEEVRRDLAALGASGEDE